MRNLKNTNRICLKKNNRLRYINMIKDRTRKDRFCEGRVAKEKLKENVVELSNTKAASDENSKFKHLSTAVRKKHEYFM